MTALFRCIVDHPHRPPTWRWDRAGIVLTLGSRAPGTEQDDRLIKATTCFRKQILEATDEVSLFQCFCKAGHLGRAYQIWDDNPIPARPAESTKKPQSRLRFEIEARILARESMTQIAAKCGQPVDTIKHYEKIFFNVLDRIDQSSWVVHQVIGPLIHDGFTIHQVDVMWRLWAWATRSPELIDKMVSTFNSGMSATPDDFYAFIREDQAFTHALKAGFGTRMIELTGRTAPRVIELQAAMDQARKQDEDVAINNASYAGNIQKAFEVLHWAVGGALASKIGTGGEPRAKELIELSSGVLTALPKSDFVFPEVGQDRK